MGIRTGGTPEEAQLELGIEGMAKASLGTGGAGAPPSGSDDGVGLVAGGVASLFPAEVPPVAFGGSEVAGAGAARVAPCWIGAGAAVSLAGSVGASSARADGTPTARPAS